ncbi:MAG: hypothetical protein ACJ735_16005 [Actinomycetes bacterium]
MVTDSSGEFIGTTPAPPSGDRVELTDLEVIQRWSLAVRGASAERSDVVAALRADLDWLEGRRRPAERSTDAPAPRTTTARAPAARKATTARAPAKKAAAKKKSTARSGAARGGTRRR